MAETCMRLRQASGNYYGFDSQCSSLGTSFTNGRAIYSVDFEKIGAQALFSGVSTKGGETLTMEFRNVANIEAGDYICVFQVTDVIVNLRLGGADILD